MHGVTMKFTEEVIAALQLIFIYSAVCTMLPHLPAPVWQL